MAAKDIKEVLSKYVPAAVLDQAVDEIRDTDIAPEWFRQEAAKLGADAKEAAELRAKLESIESAPKRKEALRRVGIDYDQVPKYGQEALDSLPAGKLDDLEFVASYVKDKGFEAAIQQTQPGEQNQAEQIVNFSSNAGQGAPLQRGNEDDFYRELDAIPDGDKQATRKVLEKYGKAQPSEGLALNVTEKQG